MGRSFATEDAMTNSAFHIRSFGTTGIVRAWLPNGKNKKSVEPGSRSIRAWQVAYDPSGTIRLIARFSRYEVMWGINHGTWERETMFADTKSKLMYYYDHQLVRLRKGVRVCETGGPKNVKFIDGKQFCIVCGEVLK